MAIPSKLSDWTREKNLLHLPARGPEAMQETLLAVYDWLAMQHRWDLVDQVQTLTAKNDTRRKLNRELQALLNRDGGGNHKTFKIGDKIINLRNNLFESSVSGRPPEYVANGDIGRVQGFSGR